jgi:ribosomal peptide maturation radical SAM protein 1
MTDLTRCDSLTALEDLPKLETFLRPSDVLIVVPPFISICEIPHLGAHAIQAAAREAGFAASVFYSNLHFLQLSGPLPCHLNYQFYVENWLFARHAFPDVIPKQAIEELYDENWVPDLFGPTVETDLMRRFLRMRRPWRQPDERDRLNQLADKIERWLDLVTEGILRLGCRVVGCSNSFGPLSANLAIFRRLKALRPDIVTVLGGALCDPQTVEGLLALSDVVDYIFDGEGDEAFPCFLKEVFSGEPSSQKIIHCQPVADLDALPVPDYSDFILQYKQAAPFSSRKDATLYLGYEASRGCSWSRCKFCSAPREWNPHRKKSHAKVLSDLTRLRQMHGTIPVFFSDAALSRDLISELFPEFPRALPGFRGQILCRGDLSLKDIRTLRDAGIEGVFVGIEALDSDLLRLMNKGVSVRRNLAFLRHARSLGIRAQWLMLYGFPGDRIDSYEWTLRVMPLLMHLAPPQYLYPLIIERNSPLFREPERYGIHNVRPAAIYRDILPPLQDYEPIAFWHRADFDTALCQNPETLIYLLGAWSRWRAAWQKCSPDGVIQEPCCEVREDAQGRFELFDTRGIAGFPEIQTLTFDQAAAALIERPLRENDAAADWARKAGLGLALEGWHAPLATASPDLILQFESYLKTKSPAGRSA